MINNKLALAIHGGAGTVLQSEMTAAVEREYHAGLQTALAAGWQILLNGGSSLDAVTAAVVELENFPLFNAGRGAVFTHEGVNELDASLMDGAKLTAGAIAGARNVKNPIKLARLVMEKTEHILLAGAGANEFARLMNVEMMPDAYFFTENRYQQFLAARAANVVQLDHADKIQNAATEAAENSKFKIRNPKSKMGTVGAAACDVYGNLTAATSTGGMTNKKHGRIGDSPLIGAGTYAENSTCAVSCTGHGEFFMLGVAAYDVAARMKYKNIDLKTASAETIRRLTEIGGEGGLIAVDRFGNVALPFNSEGMYRAFVTTDQSATSEIYAN